MREQRCPVEDAKDNVGVTDVHRKQHAAGLIQSEPTRHRTANNVLIIPLATQGMTYDDERVEVLSVGLGPSRKALTSRWLACCVGWTVGLGPLLLGRSVGTRRAVCGSDEVDRCCDGPARTRLAGG